MADAREHEIGCSVWQVGAGYCDCKLSKPPEAPGPTTQDWKGIALALFSVEGQYPLSWIVKFKGEFLDEFAEEDAANGFVEDWAQRMADFADSVRAGVAEAGGKLVNLAHRPKLARAIREARGHKA